MLMNDLDYLGNENTSPRLVVEAMGRSLSLDGELSLPSFLLVTDIALAQSLCLIGYCVVSQ